MDDVEAAEDPVTGTSPSRTTGSQTLRRGLKAIALLADHQQGLRLPEVAKALGVNRNAAYRLLIALMDEGFATRDSSDSYRLGLRLIELSGQVMPGLRERVRPVLIELAEQLGATMTLTIADGEDAVAIEVAEPRSTIIHVAYRLGARRPLTVGASGIAILAQRPASPADSPEVASARDKGWSESRNALNPGAVGVAVPIGAGEMKTLASISAILLGDEQRDRAVQSLLAAAARIAER